MKRIDPDVVVTASFTLHNGDGQLVDYAPQDQPMVWVFGYNQLLPALERELIGAQEGEVRKITLTPKDAYGEHVPSSEQIISRADFPSDPPPKPGMTIFTDFGDGPTPLRISKVDGDEITIDFNHPLAGQTLTWVFKIHSLRRATPDEINDLTPRGHAH